MAFLIVHKTLSISMGPHLGPKRPELIRISYLHYSRSMSADLVIANSVGTNMKNPAREAE
ncbi:hypothetical protein AC579_7964 [Pseudocercospora musae]|uniref:Uncharacterized protein n=1 Tax=Pseudocercospora musae TaxID=113226 RepID=A0A139H6K7_9PEZI|nr:hypothetical protein AC579_7964 [Pseudocercospora musae]